MRVVGWYVDALVDFVDGVDVLPRPPRVAELPLRQHWLDRNTPFADLWLDGAGVPQGNHLTGNPTN